MVRLRLLKYWFKLRILKYWFKLRILKYWFKLIQTDNIITQDTGYLMLKGYCMPMD